MRLLPPSLEVDDDKAVFTSFFACSLSFCEAAVASVPPPPSLLTAAVAERGVDACVAPGAPLVVVAESASAAAVATTSTAAR